MNTGANGFLGGLLIGLAATLLLWSIGRIAGIAFLAGMMIAGALVMQIVPSPERIQTGATPILLAAGFLVGFGTRIGGGCTSGHGVCGLGRLSSRSAAAVVTFMAAGMVTVFVMRHLPGLSR
jgi:uncharacterized membrane protein YedE/YeeE